MSKQLFRARIKFDTNFGYDEEMTLYILENNCIDYRYIVDERGNEPPAHGSDAYCDAIASVISLKSDCVEECTIDDLPNPVKIAFNLKKPDAEFSLLSILNQKEICFTCTNASNISKGMSKCRIESPDSNDHYCFYSCKHHEEVDENTMNERIFSFAEDILPNEIEADGSKLTLQCVKLTSGIWSYAYVDKNDCIPMVSDGNDDFFLSSVAKNQSDAVFKLGQKVSRYLNHK